MLYVECSSRDVVLCLTLKDEVITRIGGAAFAHLYGFQTAGVNHPSLTKLPNLETYFKCDLSKGFNNLSISSVVV